MLRADWLDLLTHPLHTMLPLTVDMSGLVGHFLYNQILQEVFMNTADEREIKRKLKVIHHAEQSGNAAKTCRYFGVSRSTFYR